MTQPQTSAPRAAVALTPRDIDEIEGIADLGMPIGGTLIGRLCADWRRLTAERDAAVERVIDTEAGLARAIAEVEHISANESYWRLRATRALSAAPAPAPVPVPVPAADVPPFLAARLNGGAA